MRDEHEANDSDVPEGTDVDGLLLETRVSDESEKYNSMVDVDDCHVLSSKCGGFQADDGKNDTTHNEEQAAPTANFNIDDQVLRAFLLVGLYPAFVWRAQLLGLKSSLTTIETRARATSITIVLKLKAHWQSSMYGTMSCQSRFSLRASDGVA